MMNDDKKENLKAEASGSAVNESYENVIRETIKQRPVDKRKVLRRTLMTVLLALLFGAVASLTFFFLEPVIDRNISPENENAMTQITLPEAATDEEITPDKMYEDDEELREASVVSKDTDIQSAVDQAVKEMTVGSEEYKQMYSSLRVLSNEAKKSVVTVTSVNRNVDWLNNTVESENTAEGVIVAETDIRLIVAVTGVYLSDAEGINVTLASGESVDAELLGVDDNTGISVLAVRKSALSEKTLNTVKEAVLVSTDTSSVAGRPVIAIGSLTGEPGAVDYGIISSASRILDMPDSWYRFFLTDMNGSSSSNGVLFDLNGSVIGFIKSDDNAASDPGVITAISSAGVKGLINKMSNREERAVLGIHAIDVPESAIEEDDVPGGVAITQVEVGSPAMDAGLRSGDIITSAKGTAVNNYQKFLELLDSAHPGDIMVISGKRPGNEGYEDMRAEVLLGGG
ncbi:MAG: S1C family serine protease [Lachnospiraceae bacterium]|nr:S1C family serine protease [Lachnospiraceae bacterium]